MSANSDSTSLGDFGCVGMKKPASITTSALALDEIITQLDWVGHEGFGVVEQEKLQQGQV